MRKGATPVDKFRNRWSGNALDGTGRPPAPLAEAKAATDPTLRGGTAVQVWGSFQRITP